jgi:UDP-glucose 6-dehydrogenase
MIKKEEFDMDDLEGTEVKFCIGLVGNGPDIDALKFGFHKPRNEIVHIDGTENTLEDLFVAAPHIVFIATPTETVDGVVTATHIEDQVIRIMAQSPAGIVIKTPMPVELVDRLCSRDGRIVYSPNIITEGESTIDKVNLHTQILGGHPKATLAVQEIFFRFSQLKIVNFTHLSATEAALAEHCISSLLAMKSTFFNQLYDIVQEYGGSYTAIANAIGADPRIGSSMNTVPTIRLNRGFDHPRMIQSIKELVKFNEGFTLLKEVDTINDGYLNRTKE